MARRGPGAANGGIDRLRFAQPTYPVDEIHVVLTCKRKPQLDEPRLHRGGLEHQGHEPSAAGPNSWHIAKVLSQIFNLGTTVGN